MRKQFHFKASKIARAKHPDCGGYLIVILARHLVGDIWHEYSRRRRASSERPLLKSEETSKTHLSRNSDGNLMENTKRKPGRRSGRSGTQKKFPLPRLMLVFKRWAEPLSRQKETQELVGNSCHLRSRCLRRNVPQRRGGTLAGITGNKFDRFSTFI
ncbi:hypothetical protein AVEN_163338-1 [Araneus ventricosus]|uniref:Uncharacterized protein n=1 Tax=Araneus ventricosus TaxID=182803 RepID=A0A4Y2SAB4_ARAVE|nr:hypothetical protein AVEN_163338-1 [Araneus ventricosus]